MMPIPGGWLLLSGPSVVARGSYAAVIAAGVQRDLIEIERRVAVKTGEAMDAFRPHPGVRVVPARMVERLRRVA